MTGWRTITAALVVAGCSQRLEPVDTGLDTNDTGNHTGDTGNHTGDTGSDTSSLPFDCDAVAGPWDEATPQPTETCVVEPLTCGSVVEHSTDGSTSRLELADYTNLRANLKDRKDDYSGPDNTYLVEIPASETTIRDVYAILETPCDDLYLLMWRIGSDVCELEREAGRQNASVTVTDWEQSAWVGVNAAGGTYAVVVDGHPGHSGPYRLSIECD